MCCVAEALLTPSPARSAAGCPSTPFAGGNTFREPLRITSEHRCIDMPRQQPPLLGCNRPAPQGAWHVTRTCQPHLLALADAVQPAASLLPRVASWYVRPCAVACRPGEEDEMAPRIRGLWAACRGYLHVRSGMQPLRPTPFGLAGGLAWFLVIKDYKIMRSQSRICHSIDKTGSIGA